MRSTATRAVLAALLLAAGAPLAAAGPLGPLGVVYDEVDATVRHHADGADGAAERNGTGARDDADAFARPRTEACHPVTTAYADDRRDRGTENASRAERDAEDAARYAGAVLRGEDDAPNATRVLLDAYEPVRALLNGSDPEPPATWDDVDPRTAVGDELLAAQAVAREVQGSPLCVLEEFLWPANATLNRTVNRDVPDAVRVVDAAAERAGAPGELGDAYAGAVRFADLVFLGLGIDPYGPLPPIPPEHPVISDAYDAICDAVTDVWTCGTDDDDVNDDETGNGE